MNKSIFREFITNEIESKKTLLVSNSISDEDKTAIQLQIDGLNSIVEKIDALEDEEAAAALVDELKQTVNEMGEKLTALNEKINLNLKNNETETKDETEMNKNYLSTKNSVRDFANAIRNSHTPEEFRNQWNEYLVANDVNPDSITIQEGSEDAFLPEAVRGMLSDIWERADWLRDLNYTGAKRFYVRHNISDQNDETSRAKGWKKGGTKTEQSLTLAAKLLEGQYVYKIAFLDLKTQFDTDEALIAYVLNELTEQILWEIGRCILVSDGRQAADVNKIDSFEAIGKDTSDAYTTVTTATSDFLIDDLRTMVDNINNPYNKPIYLFMNKEDFRAVSRVQASETSTPVFMSEADVASQLGVDRIIKTDLLGDDYTAICFIPQEYYMVGAPNLLNPILYKWHEPMTNRDGFREETYCGGGLNGLKSSAVLLPKE